MPVLAQLAQASGGERYLHWDELRRRPAPQGLSHEQWWLAEKLSRRGTGTPLPLLSSEGSPFWFCQPPLLLKGLHEIDMKAGASVMAPEAVTTASTRDRHLLSSLMEEAITNLHAYLERKANEVAVLQRRLEGMDGLAGFNRRQLALLRHALRHAGFRYTVLSHQSSHGISNQTARSDLQKLAGRGLLTPEKDGKRELFRVPADLATRLPS